MNYFTYSLCALACIPHAAAAEIEISDFAENVVTHVLLHELAHAIFRELDVPILSNEEAQADAFATFYVTQYLKDEAPDIILARANSWLFEDSEVSPQDYDHKGEHPLDVRRAYQTLCLFYGADPAEYSGYVDFAGFSERDLAECSDTAPDQFAAWTGIVEDLQQQGGRASIEVIYGEGPMASAFMETGLLEKVAEIAATLPWENGGITLHFDHCDRGAFWSRTQRTILLCDDYVARFIEQGAAL